MYKSQELAYILFSFSTRDFVLCSIFNTELVESVLSYAYCFLFYYIVLYHLYFSFIECLCRFNTFHFCIQQKCIEVYLYCNFRVYRCRIYAEFYFFSKKVGTFKKRKVRPINCSHNSDWTGLDYNLPLLHRYNQAFFYIKKINPFSKTQPEKVMLCCDIF